MSAIMMMFSLDKKKHNGHDTTICQPACLPATFISIPAFIPVYLPAGLATYLPAPFHVSLYLPAWLHVLPARLSFCLPAYLSSCLFCLPVPILPCLRCVYS